MSTIFCLIKFGNKEHLEKLQSIGQMRFGPLQDFRVCDEEQRGDVLEGAFEIVNGGFTDISCEHPTLGTFNFKLGEKSHSRLLQTDESPYYIFSCYALTYEMFKVVDLHKIDGRMTEFGDSALIIRNPKQFIDKVHSELTKQNISWITNLTKYKDLTSPGSFTADLFTKSDEFVHQNELRFLIEVDDKVPHFFTIGSIDDISLLHPAKTVIETEFKCVMKNA